MEACEKANFSSQIQGNTVWLIDFQMVILWVKYSLNAGKCKLQE